MKRKAYGWSLLLFGALFLLGGCQRESKETVLPKPAYQDTVCTLPSTATPTPEPLDIVVCFAGDVSLADDAVTTRQWNNSGHVLSGCISPELLTLMNAADVMCINNEFTFSTRGKPMEGKAYTFRANPERVSLLLEMGVDLALLANNHVL